MRYNIRRRENGKQKNYDEEYKAQAVKPAAEKLYVAADRLEKILAEKISSGYLKRLRGKSVPPLSAILSGGRDAVRRFAGLM